MRPEDFGAETARGVGLAIRIADRRSNLRVVLTYIRSIELGALRIQREFRNTERVEARLH